MGEMGTDLNKATTIGKGVDELRDGVVDSDARTWTVIISDQTTPLLLSTVRSFSLIYINRYSRNIIQRPFQDAGTTFRFRASGY